MRPAGPIYLDTNVLISLGEAGSLIGRRLLQMIALQKPDDAPVFLTSRLAFTELMVKPLREKDSVMASLYSAWAMSSPWLCVCDVDDRVLDLAALLRARASRVKLPDAIHLACAIVHKCPYFMTADLALQAVPVLHHPFLGPVDMAPLSVIRPDDTSLTALLESLS